MNTQKIAITVPQDIVSIVDEISQQKGISRSRLISKILRERIEEEKGLAMQATYDLIFSDDKIRKEQIETSRWFDSGEKSEGQEW